MLIQATKRSDKKMPTLKDRRDREKSCPYKGRCTFFFWNAGGISEDKYIEFKNLIVKQDVDAFGIVEAGAISDKENVEKAEMLGYNIYSLPRARRVASGILVGVKVGLTAKFQVLHNMKDDDKLELVQLDLWKQQLKTRYVIAYNPPLNETEHLTQINVDKDTVLIGDFNAPNKAWSYRETSRVGRLVEDFIDSTPLMLLEGTPTPYTFLSFKGSQSRPDLAFCHSSMLQDTTQTNLESPTGAGHKVISIKRERVPSDQMEVKTTWNFKKGKWKEYRAQTEQHFEERVESDNVDREYKDIVDIIHDAARKWIPRGKNRKYKPFWNKELQTLKENRDAARKTAEATQQMEDMVKLRRAQAKLKRNILESKRNTFEEFAEKIDYRKDGSRAHAYFSKMCNRERQSSNNNGPIVYKNKQLVEDKEKAEAICKHIANQSNKRNLGHIKTDRKPYIDDNLDPYNAPFLINEIEYAVKKLKSRKSPGVDMIYPEFLKNLGKCGRRVILNLCNITWQGNIPDGWRKAEVIPLLKKGKDGSTVEGYRPISLTSMIAKLMEHMVNFRLKCYLEANNVLAPHQAGFRNNRSTIDQIAYLQQDVKEGFSMKLSTVVTYVDFKAAFDLVDRSRLLEKMDKLKVPENIVRWTKMFLSQRFIRVRYNNKRSRYRQTKSGVPQGAVLSPTLFIIYIDDLAKYIQDRSEVKIKMYADDVVLWVKGNNKDDMEREMNKALKALEEWTTMNGMEVNETKTVYDYHTLGRTVPDFKLEYGEVTISKNVNPVYLGMTMDQKMTSTIHIEKMCENAKRRLTLMKRVAGVNWGACSEVLTTTYKTYIRPVLEYGNALLTTAPKNALNALDRVQNQALRIATGAVKSTPIAAMEALTNTQPLELRRNMAAGSLHEKLLRLDEESWNRVPYEKLKTQKTFITAAEEVKKDLMGMTNFNKRMDLPKPNIRVALLEVHHELTVDGLEKKKSEYSTQELRRHTMTYIRKKYPEELWLHVYTDGSATPGKGMAGAGVYCKKFENSWAAGKNASSYDGELKAIKVALEKVREHLDKNIVIMSDSKAAIQAIVSKEMVDCEVRECKVLLLRLFCEAREVVLQWIPAHCEVYGNEKADYLAKKGSKMPQIAKHLSYTAVKAHLSTATKTKGQKEWTKKGKDKSWQSITTEKVKQHRTRRIATAQFRLLTGHDLLAKHLHRIGITESSTCSLCGGAEQDREHLMRCPSLKDDIEALPTGMKLEEKETCLYWKTRKCMMA
jgi:ribonuclease HI